MFGTTRALLTQGILAMIVGILGGGDSVFILLVFLFGISIIEPAILATNESIDRRNNLDDLPKILSFVSEISVENGKNLFRLLVCGLIVTLVVLEPEGSRLFLWMSICILAIGNFLRVRSSEIKKNCVVFLCIAASVGIGLFLNPNTLKYVTLIYINIWLMVLGYLWVSLDTYNRRDTDNFEESS